MSSPDALSWPDLLKLGRSMPSGEWHATFGPGAPHHHVWRAALQSEVDATVEWYVGEVVDGRE